jgi:tRNA (guanine37-N1)-methyltransferase
MKFTVMTLFPEMIIDGLHTSILGKAIDKKIIELSAVNIRDYTLDKHRHVDDYPYGGGAGMVMSAEPIYRCFKSITGDNPSKKRVVYLTPQGRTFNQSMAKEFAKEDEIIFLCGHYECVDERILE